METPSALNNCNGGGDDDVDDRVKFWLCGVIWGISLQSLVAIITLILLVGLPGCSGEAEGERRAVVIREEPAPRCGHHSGLYFPITIGEVVYPSRQREHSIHFGPAVLRIKTVVETAGGLEVSRTSFRLEPLEEARPNEPVPDALQRINAEAPVLPLQRQFVFQVPCGHAYYMDILVTGAGHLNDTVSRGKDRQVLEEIVVHAKVWAGQGGP